MTTRPDVTDDAIVDFDHHSDDFNLNQRTINAELRQKCPVAWNETTTDSGSSAATTR